MACVALGLSLLAFGTAANAWLSQGHRLMSEHAVRVLPEEVPAWFRSESAGRNIGYANVEVDLMRELGGPELRGREGPNHYMAVELLPDDGVMPADRHAYIEWAAKKNMTPSRTGLVYYATLESLNRLEIAFAQHRRWPHVLAIQARCIQYAGELAHFAQDLCMPLHTSIHHDGREKRDGTSPRTGVHFRMDDLPFRLKLTDQEIANDLTPQVIENLGQEILKQMRASNARTDRVYELQDQLPPQRGDWTPTPEIRELGLERTRASVQLTASLFLTAWKRSEETVKKMPGWAEMGPEAR